MANIVLPTVNVNSSLNDNMTLFVENNGAVERCSNSVFVATSQLLDMIYPVGSIYMSVNYVSPATFLGGTWEQIQNKFLLSSGSTYAAGTTGGSASHTHTSAAHTHTTAGHTLTVNEMPAHRHTLIRQRWYSADSNVANSSTGSIYGATTTTPAYYSTDKDMQTTGGGASHSHGNTGSTTPGATGSSSNLPPYLVVYMWKRTA